MLRAAEKRPPRATDPRRTAMAITVIAEKSRSVLRPTLSMVGITKHFDAVVALRNVSFEVLWEKSTPCSVKTAPASRR